MYSKDAINWVGWGVSELIVVKTKVTGTGAASITAIFCLLCCLSTNQRLVLYCVNQSEINMVLYQPIREWNRALSQKFVIFCINQSEGSIYLDHLPECSFLGRWHQQCSEFVHPTLSLIVAGAETQGEHCDTRTECVTEVVQQHQSVPQDSGAEQPIRS